MEVRGKQAKNKRVTKASSKKALSTNDGLNNDPNAVRDIYNERDLDPAYDKKIGDDIAFDSNNK